MRTHALCLAPGDDLRASLERAAREHDLAAACILTCVGSLARARLRLAGAQQEREWSGPLEIVSLVGTLSPDGPHLHIALADGEGRVLGGHLLAGSIVHTTAEILLGEPERLRFERREDPATGWRELVIRARE